MPAAVARDADLERDVVPDVIPDHPRTDRLDGPRGLVAQRERAARLEVAVAAVLVVRHIAPADTRPPDGNLELAGTRIGQAALLLAQSGWALLRRLRTMWTCFGPTRTDACTTDLSFAGIGAKSTNAAGDIPAIKKSRVEKGRRYQKSKRAAGRDTPRGGRRRYTRGR
jgi:hypothetical protein